jgi:hypothetical protein
MGLGGATGAGGAPASGGAPGSGGAGYGGSSAGGTTGAGGGAGAGGATTDSGAAGAGAAPDGGTSTGAGADAAGAITPTTPGQLVITEIMADTTAVPDDTGEWFEVYNPSATDTLNLAGCTLFDKDNTHVVSRDVLVRPGAFVTLARFGDITGGFIPDYNYNPNVCPVSCPVGCAPGCPTVKFSNSGDEAGVACDSTIIDVVDFISWPVPKGRSFSLDPRHYDAAQNDVQSNWCQGTTLYNMTTGPSGGSDYGSPGITNPQCPF